jgi:GntR family transcriptional regulator
VTVDDALTGGGAVIGDGAGTADGAIPEIVVDDRSAIPVYEQIRSQVAGFVYTGALRPGARLPTVRALAADLQVAVNTVARAYQGLEEAGLVRSRRRIGTVVQAPARPGGDLARSRAAARQLAEEATAAGVGEEAAVALLREALAAVSKPDSGKESGS